METRRSILGRLLGPLCCGLLLFVLMLLDGSASTQTYVVDAEVKDDSNNTCLYARWMMNFSITYETNASEYKNKTFTLPENVSYDGSSCGNETSGPVLAIEFGAGHFWSINFAKTDEDAYQGNITFIYNTSDEKLFPDAKRKGPIVTSAKYPVHPITLHTVYTCHHVDSVKVGNVTNNFWNLSLQAFLQNGSLSTIYSHCDKDITVSVAEHSANVFPANTTVSTTTTTIPTTTSTEPTTTASTTTTTGSTTTASTTTTTESTTTASATTTATTEPTTTASTTTTTAEPASTASTTTTELATTASTTTTTTEPTTAESTTTTTTTTTEPTTIESTTTTTTEPTTESTTTTTTEPTTTEPTTTTTTTTEPTTTGSTITSTTTTESTTTESTTTTTTEPTTESTTTTTTESTTTEPTTTTTKPTTTASATTTLTKFTTIEPSTSTNSTDAAVKMTLLAPAPLLTAREGEKPVTGNYSVNVGATACLLASMGLQLNISEEQAPWIINIEPNATEVTGSCGERSAELRLNDSNNVIIDFFFEVKNASLERFYLKGVNITVVRPANGSLHAANYNLSQWVASVGSSYMCRKEETLFVTDTYRIKTFDVRVQPFAVKENKYATAEDCSPEVDNYFVPIVVAAALAGLVCLIFMAYFVGRRKHRGDGYEQF